MQAVHHVGYGDPRRATRLVTADKPTPNEDQVLVRVRASSINALDWRAVYADPAFIRLISGMRRPRDPALGADAAGVVEAVGSAVSHLAVGDEVYGIRSGAMAEYVAGKEFYRKPANLSFEEAAAIPVAGATALQALQKYGNIQPGQRVVVNGAGGGVGHLAVQIAKALGAEVTAVTSTDKADWVRSLGADHVVDYRQADFTKGDRRYDLVVDVGGNRSIGAMRRVLAPGGQIMLVAAGHGGFGTLGRVIGGSIRRRVGQPLRFFVAGGPYDEQLATLRELIEEGKVRPHIDRTFALADAAEAIRYVAKEGPRGKVAVSIP